LIDSRGGSQSLLSGNANGFVPQSVTLRGRLVWSHLFRDRLHVTAGAGRILINSDVIGVVLQEDLLLYDTAGNAIVMKLSRRRLAAFGTESYCWIRR
jgi:hypothetical protein